MSADPSLPEGRGPLQGAGIIGDVTEAMQAWLNDGWSSDRPPPRIVEDLAFEPKDREEVVYVYMYRVAKNTALQNTKRWRQANVQVERDDGLVLYSRAPLYLDLFYLVSVHSKFRSDAERLLGWVLMRLHEATHLVYRPRRYVLPGGKEVDATGTPYDTASRGDGVIMEKVSLDLVDDLTLGDAVHFYNIHEAPYRPYVTYRARCAMEGALVEAPPTIVRPGRVDQTPSEPAHRPGSARARSPIAPARRSTPIGPGGTPPEPTPPDTTDED